MGAFVRLISTALTVMMVVEVSACQTPPPSPPPKQDMVKERLAEAADKAVASLRDLAEAEQAHLPVSDAAAEQAGDVPAELAREVTMGWVGPIEPLAQKLAKEAGYSYRALGRKPAIPVVVDLDKKSRRIVDALRDIGLQGGKRVDVAVVYDQAGAGTVEVRYAQP